MLTTKEDKEMGTRTPTGWLDCQSGPPAGPPPFYLPSHIGWLDSQEYMRRLPEQYLQQIFFRPASANTSPVTLRQLCQESRVFRGLVDSNRILFTEKDVICISIIWPGYEVFNEGLRVGPGHGALSGVCTMGELAHEVGWLYCLFLWKIKRHEHPEGNNPHWSIIKNPHLFNKDTICIKSIHRLGGKSFQVIVEIIPPPNATHGFQA